MSEMDHNHTEQDRTNTDENFKILQRAALGKPNPSRMSRVLKEQLAIIEARFDEPLAGAEERLAEAVALAQGDAVEQETDLRTAETADRLMEKNQRFDLINAFYQTKRESLTVKRDQTRGILCDALADLVDRKKGQKGQEGILQNILAIKASVQKIDDSLETKEPSGISESQLDNDPAVKAAEELLEQIKLRIVETRNVLIEASNDYRKELSAYNAEWAMVYAEITGERKTNLDQAQVVLDAITTEKEETVEAFLEKAKPLVRQERNDWRKDKGLQIKDAFTRVTNSMAHTLYGAYESVVLALYTPFAEAAEGFSKETKPDAKRGALVEERAARFSSLEGP